MGTRRITLGLAALVVAVLALPSFALGAWAQSSASPCAPGQAPGRPPGQPPSSPPGQPANRPPQYPPGQCQLQLSRNTVAAGQSLTVSGSGYDPGSGVHLQLFRGQSGQALGAAPALAAIGLQPERSLAWADRVLGTQLAQAATGRSLATVSANGQGQFSTDVTIPGDVTPGRYTITATGYRNGAPYELAADLMVTAAGTGAARGGGGNLPRTGAFIAGLAALGAALTGAGTVAVVAARRRRTAGAP